MTISMASCLHPRNREHLPGNPHGLSIAKPAWIQIGSNWSHRNREVRKRPDYVTQDYLGGGDAFRAVGGYFCLVPPTVAIDVAVIDASSSERRGIRLGEVVISGKRQPQELE